MAASEWEELESLSRDIGDARERLQAAKTRKKFDMARVLEEEIADLENRQSELLGAIANSVVSEQGEATEASHADSTGDPPIILTAPDPNKSGDAELSTQCDREETAVWTQLTQADVEHARQGLVRQRIETLARHAAELQSLEADGAEVAALEQAIHAFVCKYGGAEVVPLDPTQSGAQQ